MGDDDDRPVPGREVPQRGHDRLVESRVETRGRLVEEEQRRTGEQFHRHRRPFALSAGQAADPGAGVLGEPEFGDRLLDAGDPLGGPQVGREAQLRGIPQRLAHAQLTVDQVVLGDDADLVAHDGIMPMDIEALIGDRARGRRPGAGEHREQRRLPGPGRADDGGERPRREVDVDPLEQGASVRQPIVDPANAEGDVRPAFEAGESLAIPGEDPPADTEQLARPQFTLDDGYAVHERPVGAADVANVEPPVAERAHPGMDPGHEQVVHHEIARGIAAERPPLPHAGRRVGPTGDGLRGIRQRRDSPGAGQRSGRVHGIHRGKPGGPDVGLLGGWGRRLQPGGHGGRRRAPAEMDAREVGNGLGVDPPAVEPGAIGAAQILHAPAGVEIEACVAARDLPVIDAQVGARVSTKDALLTRLHDPAASGGLEDEQGRTGWTWAHVPGRSCVGMQTSSRASPES